MKEGKIIDFQKNWKNRGYDTAVFAAPIKIANKDYFMAAVIVVEAERNSYYLHEVAIQEKEDNTLFKTGTVKNGTSGKVLSSPIFTLLQKLQSVKNELSGKEKSLPTTADAKSPASTSETNSGTASKNSISNATENVNNDNTKYQSRNTDIDDEYLEAVENNDLETAQKLVDDCRATKERHFSFHNRSDKHTNPHDHIINWDNPMGHPDPQPPINYPNGAPEFKSYKGLNMQMIENKNTINNEENRFKTISEFKWCMRFHGEVEFKWKGKLYSITHLEGRINIGEGCYEKDGKYYNMNSHAEYSQNDDMWGDTADDILEYIVSGDKLRDVITQVEVIVRTI